MTRRGHGRETLCAYKATLVARGDRGDSVRWVGTLHALFVELSMARVSIQRIPQGGVYLPRQ